MRKQTKIVAVASAAALLAIGASMTSFAATGWVEEDGTWYFYDKDGNKVEDEWKKSGDNWYWLDSEEGGAMATDKLIDDDDNTYYVDGNGVMVTNTWVKVVNEDQDEDDDPAEYHYYYMQGNGKAYKNESSDKLRKKTIDGKVYAFDDEGIMLYGWVDGSNGERLTGDTGWSSASGDTYYFGSWEDGSMKTGWQKITVFDDLNKDDDYDYWFNFKSNGKLRTHSNDDDTWKSNGKYYHFDSRGVMVYEWFQTGTASSASPANWSYFNSPEDGARMTKGWFKVIPPTEDNSFLEGSNTFASGDSRDENERWYYAENKGELASGEIKKIKGKYYGFFPEGHSKAGAMLNGLCALEVDKAGTIVSVIADGMDSDDLDDCMDGTGDFSGVTFGYDSTGETWTSLYYFGNDADSDGAMKTGSTTINLDGDSYNFMFSKSGGSEGKGRGLTGIYDGKTIYKYGLKMKADSDDKYKVVYATSDTGDTSAQVVEIDTSKMRAIALTADGKNKDDDTVRYFGNMGAGYYLLNTSGAITKDKTGAKDGNDWYFYVDNKEIKMYVNTKTLTADGTGKVCASGTTTELKNWATKDKTTGNPTVIAPPSFNENTIAK